MAFLGFDIHEDCKELTRVRNFYDSSPTVLKHNNYLIQILFEQLLYEFHARQAYYKNAMEAFVEQILIRVFRVFRHGAEDEEYRVVENKHNEGLVGTATLKALRYIDNNILNITSVSELAKELKYNHSYLSNEFSRAMGITLRDYIETKKVELGKSFLKEGLNVTQTASKLGYASSQSFCKMFTRRVGYPPSALRQNMDTQVTKAVDGKRECDDI